MMIDDFQRSITRNISSNNKKYIKNEKKKLVILSFTPTIFYIFFFKPHTLHTICPRAKSKCNNIVTLL